MKSWQQCQINKEITTDGGIELEKENVKTRNGPKEKLEGEFGCAGSDFEGINLFE